MHDKGHVVYVNSRRVTALIDGKIVELDHELRNGGLIPRAGQDLHLKLSPNGEVLEWSTERSNDQPQATQKQKERRPATLQKQRLEYVSRRNIRFGTVKSFNRHTQVGVIMIDGSEFRFYFQDKRLPMVFCGNMVWIEDDHNQIRYFPKYGDKFVVELDDGYYLDGRVVWAWTLPMFYESARMSCD